MIELNFENGESDRLRYVGDLEEELKKMLKNINYLRKMLQKLAIHINIQLDLIKLDKERNYVHFTKT